MGLVVIVEDYRIYLVERLDSLTLGMKLDWKLTKCLMKMWFVKNGNTNVC